MKATGNLNRGDGAYFTTSGIRKNSVFNFYDAGSGYNSCGATDSNREKNIYVEWKKDTTITWVIYGDKDPDFPQKIAVFLGDEKIYTFDADIPHGSDNVYAYIGAGYPDDLAGKWQNAAPAFRYAALPL